MFQVNSKNNPTVYIRLCLFLTSVENNKYFYQYSTTVTKLLIFCGENTGVSFFR